MNKFAINKLHRKTVEQPKHVVNTDFLDNKNEFENQSSEDNKIYNRIHMIVGEGRSIHLNDQLGVTEQLLYLLFDLKGKDPFLDYMFGDPTEEYINSMTGRLEINDKTKEIVRKNLHHYLYHHLVSYNYKKLESIAINMSEN